MSYKRNTKPDKSKRDTWIVIGFLLFVVAVIAAIVLFSVSSSDKTPETEEPVAEMPFDVPGFTMLEDAPHGDLNDKLSVSCMGTYSGCFLEDGSDEQVTDVLAVVVKNISSNLIEYGLITLDCGGETASFELSGLPANSYVLVMEKDRRAYDASAELSNLTCVQYAEPNNLIMDFGNDFNVYPSDGVINIENISGRDIQNDVSVFYKNFEYGLFMGGITYRARFSGGIPAGEIAQAIQPHYFTDTSAILYMSYEQ